MEELLNNTIPNVMERKDIFFQCTFETIEMVLKAGTISFIIGILLAVIITVTNKSGIYKKVGIYHLIDKLINLFRSIPFVVLMMCLVPLTRLVSGTSIGVKGAILPLTVGCVPFFTRQMEAALAGVNPGLIEAAQAMGLSNLEIILNVYLRESIAGIARGATISLISLIGLTAMAGAIGAGGLGNFAIMYGHQRNMPDVTYTTVLVLVIMVTIIQVIGNLISKKNTH